MGLLDGLVEDLEREDPTLDSVTKNERIGRTECLVREYSDLIDRQEVELHLLHQEYSELTKEDAPVLITTEFPPATPNIENLSRMDSEANKVALAEMQTAIERVCQSIQETFDELSAPLGGNNGDNSGPIYRTVDNKTLLLHNWRPEDYRFYLEKIDRAVAILAAEHHIVVEREALLQGERELAAFRIAFQRRRLDRIVDVTQRLAVLVQMLISVLVRHGQLLDSMRNNVKDVLEELQTRQSNLHIFCHKPSSKISRMVAPLRHPLLPSSVVQLDQRLSNMSAALQTLDQIKERLVVGTQDVEPISHQVRQIEAHLRTHSLSLSQRLSQATTDSTRVRLLLQK